MGPSGHEAPFLEAYEPLPADDHVVQQLDVQQLARLDQLAGEGRVLGAGRRVLAGVVMADDDAGDGLDDRRAEDLGGPDDGRGDVCPGR